MRFITNKDEIKTKIEEFLLTKNKDYAFPSVSKSIFSKYERVLDKDYSNYADKVVRETISAFYYYGHPEIKTIQNVQYFKNGEFDVIPSEKNQITYSIYFNKVYKNDEGKYEIPTVTIGEKDKDLILFDYDGNFTYNYENLEPIRDTVDIDDPNAEPITDHFTDD